MDSRVVFKKTARLAITAGLAASMTLGSFPVAVFADAAAEPASQSSVEQTAAKAEAVPTVEQKALQEESVEVEPTVEVASTAADQPAAKSATTQDEVDEANGTLQLHGIIAGDLTISTANLKVTAAEGTVVKGKLTVQADGVSISGVHFIQDGTTSGISDSLYINNAKNVTVSGCTFDIADGAKANGQLSSIRVAGTSTNVTIGGNNIFNIATHPAFWTDQANNKTDSQSWAGVNLIGGQLGTITVSNNTLNAMPGAVMQNPPAGAKNNGQINLAVANGNITEANKQGIERFVVSGNTVTNKTNLPDANAKIYGVVIGNVKVTEVTDNTFAGTCALTYSIWRPADGQIQSAGGTLAFTGNTVATMVGINLGHGVLEEGGLTESGNTFTEDVVAPSKGDANVVQDGSGKVYSSVAEALKANAEKIILLQDTDENVTIPTDKTVAFDLNGHKLTNKVEEGEDPSHTITNKGTLTVTDSSKNKTGVVDNVSNGRGALYNDINATATIEGGNFTRSQEQAERYVNSDGKEGWRVTNSWYVIKNFGDLTIKDGSFSFGNQEKDFNSSLIGSGWFNSSLAEAGTNGEPKPSLSKDKAKLTISGGTFTGGKIVVKNDDYGTLDIFGGTFNQTTDDYYTVMNANIAQISGGTFNGGKKSPLMAVMAVGDAVNNGKTAITGGVFNVSADQEVLAYEAYVNGAPLAEISGGTFKGNAPDSKYIVPGSGLVQNTDGSFSVKEAKWVFSTDVKDGTYTYDVKDGKELTPEELSKLANVDVQGWTVDVGGDFDALNAAIAAKDTSKTFKLIYTASREGSQSMTQTLVIKLVDSMPKPEPEPEPEPTPEPTPEPETKYYTVTFVDGIAGTKDETQKVAEGKVVAKPADPTYDGWEFAGWYTSEDFKELYDFEKPVTGDITLYAGWHKVGSDEVTEPEKTEKLADKKSDGKALPQTGDNSALPMVAAAGAGAVAVAAGAVAMKRRKQE